VVDHDGLLPIEIEPIDQSAAADSTLSIGGNEIACAGQVLAHVVQPTMQFKGVTQVPQPMQASSMIVGFQ
jgi:hypothetical protein